MVLTLKGENPSFSSFYFFTRRLLTVFLPLEQHEISNETEKRCAIVILFISSAGEKTRRTRMKRKLFSKCSTSGWESSSFRRRKKCALRGSNLILKQQVDQRWGFSPGAHRVSVIRFNETFLLFLFEAKDFFLQMFDHYNWFMRLRLKNGRNGKSPRGWERMVRVFVLARERVLQCVFSDKATARRSKQAENRKDHSIIALCWCNTKSFLYSVRGRFCNILKKGLCFFICHRSIILNASVASP